MKTQTLSLAALCALAALAPAQTKGQPATPKTTVPSSSRVQPGQAYLLLAGSDDCSTAMANDSIAGVGTFVFDNTVATNGAPIGTCGSMGSDVWFYWTASMSGIANVNTCGGAGNDTVLAAWNDDGGGGPGSCPATQIVCNDDSCGLQSSISFPVTAGSKYFLEIGDFAGGTGGAGTFAISIAPPLTNDSCATPVVIAGSGTFPFDNSAATTGVEGQAEASCFFFNQYGIVNDAWWTWTPTLTGSVTLQTCSLLTSGTDTKIAVYDGAGCPTASAIACVDDACGLQTLVTFNAVCGQTYTIQLGGYPYATPQTLAGSFNIVESGAPCGPPATPICFGDGSGTACPCGNSGAAGNGCASSVNAAGANLGSSGAATIGSDTLVLVGTGLPNSTCLYFQGSAQINGGAGVAFGDGLRCAGGTVVRLGTKTNVAGASQYPVAGDPSVSVRGLCNVGDSRVYQIWYRNAAAFCTPSTFNLTNAVSVTWQ